MKKELDFELFSEYTSKNLGLFNNAGLVISVVSDKEILYEKGFGFRDIENKLPFTSKTLFPLGSHTKSFTATAIAMLVDNGKLNWDEPIRNYISDFKMKNPYVTERITIRDVLSHTTGLPHHQFTFMNSDWIYKDIFKRLPYLEQSHEFRTIHKYSNLNFFIATKIVEDLSEQDYFSFIKNEIFIPLGMKKTNFSITDSFKSNDFTFGYRISDDGFIKEIYPDLKFIATGAGNLNSCLEDMNKWLQFHLNYGKVNGKELISENVLRELYKTQRIDNNPFALISPNENYVQNYGFALGWWAIDYRGTKIIQHPGTGPGLIFNGGFMPKEKIGYAIFANTSGSDLPFILNFHIADQILGFEPYDWGDKLKEFEDMQTKAMAKKKNSQDDLQKKETKLSHPLEDYVGIYYHPGYGELEFYLEKNSLKAKYGKELNVETNHYHYETVTIKIIHLGGFGVTKFVTFRDNFQGEITHLEINAEPSVKPSIFEKIK